MSSSDNKSSSSTDNKCQTEKKEGVTFCVQTDDGTIYKFAVKPKDEPDEKNYYPITIRGNSRYAYIPRSDNNVWNLTRAKDDDKYVKEMVTICPKLTEHGILNPNAEHVKIWIEDQPENAFESFVIDNNCPSSGIYVSSHTDDKLSMMKLFRYNFLPFHGVHIQSQCAIKEDIEKAVNDMYTASVNKDKASVELAIIRDVFDNKSSDLEQAEERVKIAEEQHKQAKKDVDAQLIRYQKVCFTNVTVWKELFKYFINDAIILSIFGFYPGRSIDYAYQLIDGKYYLRSFVHIRSIDKPKMNTSEFDICYSLEKHINDAVNHVTFNLLELTKKHLCCHTYTQFIPDELENLWRGVSAVIVKDASKVFHENPEWYGTMIQELRTESD